MSLHLRPITSSSVYVNCIIHNIDVEGPHLQGGQKNELNLYHANSGIRCNDGLGGV